MTMQRDGLTSTRGIVSAIALALGGLLLGWLCVRAAMVRSLPATSPMVERIAPDHADGVLARSTVALVKREGLLDAATLAAVRRAALADPLDARAYLILGNQWLVDGQPGRAAPTLEAGERRDPRNRLIHLLLLERYLKTERFADAAAQFAVLARLVGPTQTTIAAAMAQMTMVPNMRVAVRRTLASDPRLERQVLSTLARGDASPQDIFALASPVGIATAGEKDSWGPVLVARLVESGRYQAARLVWQRIYGLRDADIAAPIFNAAFRPLPASPPFDWTLTASSLGAADMRNGALSIDYYGRDSGDLASQLLVLAPGRYQFSVLIDAGKMDPASRIGWTIACATGAKAALATVPVMSAAQARRVSAAFTVPSGCPAQTLTLRGEAGDLPTAATVTLRNPMIRPLGAAS